MAEEIRLADRYSIGNMIGYGGFATVYKGVDEVTGQPVAIKQLKKEIVALDPAVVERFEREGEALRRLNHPNIVKMLATVQEDGNSYVIMEFVDGGDLRNLINQAWMDNNFIPIERVLEIALDLSDALIRAHRLRVIHRDIKPANVLLAKDGTPRLTDFGVARLDDSARMTQSGAMIGTLSYLSPETVGGGDVDSRSDLWAFGVMLYEMLALQRPFQQENPAALLTEIMAKPHPPIETLREDVPPELKNLIDSLLEKDPEDRISSARLVGAQIEAIMTGGEMPLALEKTPTNNVTQSLVPPTENEPTPIVTDQEKYSDPTQPGQETAQAVAQTPKPRRTLFWLLLAGLFLAVMALGVMLLTGPDVGIEEDIPITDLLFAVEPVPAGTYMVLVAQMERISGEARDVSRFIVDDLRQVLEENVPFSAIRIREYNGIITSDEEAMALAQANDAAMVLWGTYDDEQVDVNVQRGVLTPFPNVMTYDFPMEAITNLTDVRVTLTNVRRQSLAANVVATMNILHTANDDSLNIAVNLTALRLADVESGEVNGRTAAGLWHGYLQRFTSDPEGAFVLVNEALELESENPILYMGRSLGRINTGNTEGILEDFNTAAQLGPDGWLMPQMTELQYVFFFEEDTTRSREIADALASRVADDSWWELSFLSGVYLILGDYDRADEFSQQMIVLEPPVSFPYMFDTMIALQALDFVRMQVNIQKMREISMDPALVSLLLESSYGNELSSINLVLESFGYLFLGQWSQIIQTVDVIDESNLNIDEIYLQEGVAYCNLGDYAAAEAAYTRMIESDPTYLLAYLLRADVRNLQGNTAGSGADIGVLLASDARERVVPLLGAFQEGVVDCTNFLDFDFASYLDTESP